MRFKLTPFRDCQTPRAAWLPLAFVAFYASNAVFSYLSTGVPGGLAVFWPNNGAVAAALLLLRSGPALAVAVIGLAIDLLCDHWISHAPWGEAGLIAVFDFAEAWVTAVLIRQIGGAALDMIRVRRFGAMILRAVLPVTLVFGTVGAWLVHALYHAPLGVVWMNWAIGDFMGMSIGAPSILTLIRFRQFDRSRSISARSSLLLLLGLCALIGVVLVIPGRALAFLIFPLFMLAAFRLTPPYAAAGVLVSAVGGAVLTSAGLGPFAASGPGEIFRLELFFTCIVFTLFLAQGALAERVRGERRLMKALARASVARARAEAALSQLAASDQRFRLLADNASDVITRYGPTGHLKYVSPAVTAVFGYAPEELLGRSAMSLVHPDDLEAVETRFAALLSDPTAETTTDTFRGITAGGEALWMEASTRVLRSRETGAIVELQSISRDVTARKTLEVELEARRIEAEAASVAKSQFLANMSHEIRTPLNGVIATADLLARSKLEPQDRRLVEIIRSSGDSLSRLLSDILDLARIESGRVELEVRPFHLGAAVRSVAELCSLRAQEKGLGLVVEVAADADRAFAGDEVRVRQIVTNLISNAVKFTSRGEVRVRVELAPAGGVRLEVADTGEGFDPALRERLFDRFQQADGTITRRFGGTGLGLPISRQLAEAMGGGLDCDSTPGEGSRFWFWAPLPPADQAAAADEAGVLAEAVFEGRVLVVDDHPTNRTVAELILKDFGFEVEVAADGVDALETLARETFDLVLMDMQMPVMDGLTAVRELRRREAAAQAARTPVLMLTANALPEHAAQSAAAGADGHVAKPITAVALMSAILAVGEGEAAGEADSARSA